MEPANHIAVLRALQLGDMLNAIPFFRSLRAAYPDSRITLIGLPWATELVWRYRELIDDLVVFPGWPQIPEVPFDARQSLAFLQRCQAMPYDLVLQLQGSGLGTNAFVQMMGAKQSAGFYPLAFERPGPSFVEYVPYGHESERLLRLARHLDWPDAGEELSFPLEKGDWAEYEELSRELGVEPGTYAVVHVGARDRARRWSARKFAAVGDALQGAGYRVVLTGVPSEREQLDAVAGQMAAAPVIVCGRTSLGGLGCLLQRSAVVVSNDTGVAHLAVAVAAPSVVIFTNSDPGRWAATDEALHTAFIEPSALLNPCCRDDVHVERCVGDACRQVEARDHSPVAVGEVIEAALDLASRHEARHASST